ncbi:unnamed protein product, partial [Callosobruchus maculatus]
ATALGAAACLAPPLQQGDAGEDLEAGRDYRGAAVESADARHRLTLKVSEATPETGTTPVTPLSTPSGGGPASAQRRRSFYNFPFFLRHQDAVVEVDDSSGAIVPGTKKDASTAVSLHPSSAEEKTKRIGSIIRRKRVGSVKARPTSVAQGGGAAVQRTQSERYSSSSGGGGPPPDINILVTEASPESAGSIGGAGTTTTSSRPPLSRQNTEAQVVQVLVHRESEEYKEEEELEHELAEQRMMAMTPLPMPTVQHRDQARERQWHVRSWLEGQPSTVAPVLPSVSAPPSVGHSPTREEACAVTSSLATSLHHLQRTDEENATSGVTPLLPPRGDPTDVVIDIGCTVTNKDPPSIPPCS